MALVFLAGTLVVMADTFTATVNVGDTTTDKDASADKEASAGDSSTDSKSDGNDVDEIYTDKIASTPSFWQRDPRGGFANGGRDYCCPTVVSNSFVYFAEHGFPALVDGRGDRAQIALINLLASPTYFNTNPASGTSPSEVLRGAQKYVEDKGYHCERLEYEGWRSLSSDQHDLIRAHRPHLHWLKEGISDPNGTVWLNIGWYKQVGDGEWKRTGGHWLTMVGYGATSADEAADSHLLVIHNPLLKDASQNTITLEKMTEGTLDTGGNSSLDATGMFRVSGPGLPMSGGAAFLDTAIVLVLGK